MSMTPLVLIAAILAVPVLLINILRINAMMVFLSLCLGVVLVKFVGTEASDTVGILAMGTGKSNPSLISLVLLYAPAVITSVFMIRSVKSPLKRLLNFFMSFAVSALIVLLAEPYLSASLHTTLTDSVIWTYLEKLETGLITLGAIITLVLLWLQRPKHHDEGKKHGHK